ncbi:MAG: hypothetical protein AAGN15_21910 [Cyanobacteria bacterium J06581_3]
MKQFFDKATALLTGIKPFAIAAMCALVLFATATPALAFGGSNSQPEKGLEQLDGVQEKSEEAISTSSSKMKGENVAKDAQKGLNGVQGAANKGDMVSPDEANGNTIEGKIENALEEVSP